jgi:hypothetical protein
MAMDLPERPLDDVHADLERTLIDDFLRARGLDPAAVRDRDDAEAHLLLAEATTHASAKLAEVEARAHYVQDLHRRG